MCSPENPSRQVTKQVAEWEFIITNSEHCDWKQKLNCHVPLNTSRYSSLAYLQSCTLHPFLLIQCSLLALWPCRISNHGRMPNFWKDQWHKIQDRPCDLWPISNWPISSIIYYSENPIESVKVKTQPKIHLKKNNIHQSQHLNTVRCPTSGVYPLAPVPNSTARQSKVDSSQ